MPLAIDRLVDFPANPVSLRRTSGALMSGLYTSGAEIIRDGNRDVVMEFRLSSQRHLLFELRSPIAGLREAVLDADGIVARRVSPAGSGEQIITISDWRLRAGDATPKSNDRRFVTVKVYYPDDPEGSDSLRKLIRLMVDEDEG